MPSSHFLIRGGNALSGHVVVPGAKNAALKIIAACLLTPEQCILENVPQITDVFRMLKILKSMGVDIQENPSEHSVFIQARNVDSSLLSEQDVKAMRASIVLLGPLLVRCGKVSMPYPGGDVIGARSISAHLKALEQLGAKIKADGLTIEAEMPPEGFHAGRVILPEFSVTATENVLLAAAAIPGKTIVEIAAMEPHVQDLAKFLNAMGARLEIIGPHIYEVYGKKDLSGARHRIISDIIDAFTFLTAGILTQGSVSVEGVDPSFLALSLQKLREMDIDISVNDNILTTRPKLGVLSPVSVQALPYPGLPTDLQPLFAILATQAEGTTLIHDPLYENRFRYLQELVRMGANASLLDPHRVVIHGPTPLTGAPISSFDIRAGAVLAIAGLLANGVTKIEGIEHIERGYENLDGRLRELGADIQRVTIS